VALESAAPTSPPIQALVDWFPDKRGLAAGATVAGFGSGALIFSPLVTVLASMASKTPTFVGSLDTIAATVDQAGRLWTTSVNGQMSEVVMVTQGELAKLNFPGLEEGFYLVGSGNTGVAMALAAIGGLYFATIGVSAFAIRRPPADYAVAGVANPPSSIESLESQAGYVHIDSLFATPQFWLLFATSTLLATGGMGLMAVAKPMVSEVFANRLPLYVTTGFCSGFLLAMAGGNLGGRLCWSALSDHVGRRNTFLVFTMAAPPLYAFMPSLIAGAVSAGESTVGAVMLAGFCASAVAAVSVMGGNFGALAAYEADIFGQRHLDAIHGRMMLSGTLSSVLGPSLVLKLKAKAEAAAVADLLDEVGPEKFLQTFGAAIERAPELVKAKTVTLDKLVAVSNSGYDPSPYLYDGGLYAMAALAAAAGITHLMMRPVEKKHLTFD